MTDEQKQNYLDEGNVRCPYDDSSDLALGTSDITGDTALCTACGNVIQVYFPEEAE